MSGRSKKRVCPHCGTRVKAMSDSTCPTCKRAMDNGATALPKASANQTPAAATPLPSRSGFADWLVINLWLPMTVLGWLGIHLWYGTWEYYVLGEAVRLENIDVVIDPNEQRTITGRHGRIRKAPINYVTGSFRDRQGNVHAFRERADYPRFFQSVQYVLAKPHRARLWHPLIIPLGIDLVLCGLGSFFCGIMVFTLFYWTIPIGGGLVWGITTSEGRSFGRMAVLIVGGFAICTLPVFYGYTVFAPDVSLFGRIFVSILLALPIGLGVLWLSGSLSN